jgi:hypothetical protein
MGKKMCGKTEMTRRTRTIKYKKKKPVWKADNL